MSFPYDCLLRIEFFDLISSLLLYISQLINACILSFEDLIINEHSIQVDFISFIRLHRFRLAPLLFLFFFDPTLNLKGAHFGLGFIKYMIDRAEPPRDFLLQLPFLLNRQLLILDFLVFELTLVPEIVECAEYRRFDCLAQGLLIRVRRHHFKLLINYIIILMEDSQGGDHKKVERKLIKELEDRTDIQQEETKEEREESFVEVKKKRKKKKRVEDQEQTANIVPQLDLQQDAIATTTALEESKERVLTEEHRVKKDQLDVKQLNIVNQEEPQQKKRKKKREKTPELQQQLESQEENVKTEEDPPKVKKKKRKPQPEDEPVKPELEQTSAFALTEINGSTPLNKKVESNRIPLETKFSNLISQKSYNLAHQTIESADTRSCITQDIIGGDEKIKVFVRVRPMIRSEIGKVDIVFTDKNNPCVVKISDSGRYLESNFNRVFDSKASQRDIFDQIQYCIDSTLYGYNSTIFAYGQTGSGKTYSIFGDGFQKNMMQQIIQREDLRQVNNSLNNINVDSEAFKVLKKSKLGIIPRAVAHLFKAIDKKQLKCTVYLSFLQIYNEQIFDMLGASSNHQRGQLTKRVAIEKGLKIREDGQQGTYVEGLVEYVVTDKEQCYELLIRGERIRAKRQTRLNMQSSRSHTIFQLLIESDQADEHGMLKRAKLNLGDLAGSEKIFLDEFPSAQHLSELKNINLSLTTLGKVISKLTVEKSSQHVPFRDSKLTRLLQDSLGGNTRTCLLATISPLMDHFDETMSTLKFAERTKQVRIRITKNEINAQDDQLVLKLQREIQHLRDLLQMRRKGDKQSLQQQVFRLRAENDRLREIALSIEEVEKLKQENKQMRIEMQKIMLEGMIEASEEVVDRSEDGQRMSIDNSGKRNSQSQPRINQGMINETQQLQVSKSNKSLNLNRRKRIIAEINDQSPIEEGKVVRVAQDTMKFVKRRIQDTGATEEEHELQVSRETHHQPLILLEESNFDFFDNNNEIRASRVVISDLLEKQKKLRQKMNEAQLSRQESKSASKPTRDSQLEIDQTLLNQNTLDDPEDDEDFTTYYTPDLIGDKPYVSRQNLNHTRIIAGLTNKSENFEKNEESFSVQEQPYQDPKLVYNNIKQLLKKGTTIVAANRRETKHASALIDSQIEMIPLKKNLPVQHSQEVIPYPTQSSITSQSYLPNVNSRNNRMHPSRSIQPYPQEEVKGGHHHKTDTVATTTPTRTVFKTNGVIKNRNQELSPLDPYNQQHQAQTTEKPTIEFKRTMRYRNQQESRPTIRSNMTNKQPTYNHLNSGGLSQNVLDAQNFMQNRRKSNELNSFRTRNNNLVSGSTNQVMTDMNNHRRSLPKLVDNQQSTTYTTTNNPKFINKKRVLAGGGGSSFILNQEDKKKNDQEVFYRRATERLVMLEQMEQDRKKRFEQELIRLQKEQNFSLGFHNNQTGQVNPSRNTHLRRQGKTTGSSIYFNNRM